MAHVLVVDDQEMVRRVMTASLRAAGHHIVPVDSGAAALEALSGADSFDLLVLDYELGNDVGTNVYLAAVARDRAMADRVVFVTGNPSVVPIIQAVAPSAPVLLKPFGIDDLCAVVSATLATASQTRTHAADPAGETVSSEAVESPRPSLRLAEEH